MQGIDKAKLVDMVRQALYAAKICSYSQGMNIIRAKSIEKGWNINMGALARIWKVSRIFHSVVAAALWAFVGRSLNVNLAAQQAVTDYALQNCTQYEHV